MSRPGNAELGPREIRFDGAERTIHDRPPSWRILPALEAFRARRRRAVIKCQKRHAIDKLLQKMEATGQLNGVARTQRYRIRISGTRSMPTANGRRLEIDWIELVRQRDQQRKGPTGACGAPPSCESGHSSNRWPLFTLRRASSNSKPLGTSAMISVLCGV